MCISAVRVWASILAVCGIIVGASCFSHVGFAQANPSTEKETVKKDTLEIRSGPSSVPVPPSKQDATKQDVTKQESPKDTLGKEPPKKVMTRDEVLGISLEELLEMPMETVLEYAQFLDSLQVVNSSAVRSARHKKSSNGTTAASGKATGTSTLDKLNATLQRINSAKASAKGSGASPTRLSREEILRMKLKDLLDMRLGEILRLVNPVFVSSATSGARPKPR